MHAPFGGFESETSSRVAPLYITSCSSTRFTKDTLRFLAAQCKCNELYYIYVQYTSYIDSCAEIAHDASAANPHYNLPSVV